MDNYYKAFCELCQYRSIEIDINEKRYLEMRSEYCEKLVWWTEVQKCVNWLYDRQLKKINAMRLRNWITKAIQFNKDKQLKLMQYEKDKQYKERTYKRDPVWTPPE